MENINILDRPRIFVKMTNKNLKECHMSYCRVQCKREHENEMWNDIISQYEEHMEYKLANIFAKNDMFEEITRRWLKIIDNINEFRDIIEIGMEEEFLHEV